MRYSIWLKGWCLALFIVAFAGINFGQSPTPSPSPTPHRDLSFAKRLIRDQKAIWTSPFHIDRDDLKVGVPIAIATGALIATDRHTTDAIDRFGTLPAASRDVSRFGTGYSTAGIAGAFYIAGWASHNEHARRTGELAAEAMIDTLVVTDVLKVTFRRQRPFVSDRGLFFKGGSSFPSGHASNAWATATVIAYQYKNHPLIKYGAFAAAALISMSRFSGRNHFLSDVVVGSAIGFGIGRYVYMHQ
ncbi:MAG: phosphatase PAP2 family protein [Acidobacteria bacterium]|nr:phosphatase PAP2 family protein [Acidobacteriota bacterium]